MRAGAIHSPHSAPGALSQPHPVARVVGAIQRRQDRPDEFSSPASPAPSKTADVGLTSSARRTFTVLRNAPEQCRDFKQFTIRESLQASRQATSCALNLPSVRPLHLCRSDLRGNR